MKEMAKSKELKDYDKKQWEQRLLFESNFDKFKNELEEKKLNDKEKEKQLKTFVDKYHPERGYFIKYDNFILDIRKPSFIWFLIFLVMSIIGFIQSIKFIIMLFI